MKKISGETRLLLIMGLIVLAGGGYLAFSSSGTGIGPIGKPSPTPVEPTPKPLSTAEFDKLFEGAKHRKGMKDGSKADIAIVEFGDVECPSCRYAYQKLTHNFGTTIPVEFAFRHFPLPNHQYAMPCAQALEAADKQGKFWELYSALFEEESPELDINYIQTRAKKVGLNMEQFLKDSQNPEASKIVEEDSKTGQSITVMRTPTFFVLDRKTKRVDVAVGGKALLERLKGLPGVPALDATK